MKHTPTPWKVLAGTIIQNHGGIVVATTPEFQDGGLNKPREDAEFIVRACNAHDELVDALKNCLTSMDGMDYERDKDTTAFTKYRMYAANKAEAALANAEGK